jgi:hypothetical protein
MDLPRAWKKKPKFVPSLEYAWSQLPARSRLGMLLEILIAFILAGVVSSLPLLAFYRSFGSGFGTILYVLFFLFLFFVLYYAIQVLVKITFTRTRVAEMKQGESKSIITEWGMKGLNPYDEKFGRASTKVAIAVIDQGEDGFPHVSEKNFWKKNTIHKVMRLLQFQIMFQKLLLSEQIEHYAH